MGKRPADWPADRAHPSDLPKVTTQFWEGAQPQNQNTFAWTPAFNSMPTAESAIASRSGWFTERPEYHHYRMQRIAGDRMWYSHRFNLPHVPESPSSTESSSVHSATRVSRPPQPTWCKPGSPTERSIALLGELPESAPGRLPCPSNDNADPFSEHSASSESTESSESTDVDEESEGNVLPPKNNGANSV